MSRAKFQVLVIPFIIRDNTPLYCIFQRSDMDIMQFIAGGGESGETPLDAAKREANEEAGIPFDNQYYSLDTCSSIPADCFSENHRKVWGEDCFVIPEYTFAVKAESDIIRLSHEHTEYVWADYESAVKALKYDSNRTALWELDSRIKKGIIST